MRITLLATAGLSIGLVACADNRTPTGTVDVPAFDVIASPPLFQEGFESGTLASWDDGVDPALHRIITDPAVAHSGSRVLAVTYPGTGNGSWLTKFLLPGYESVHVSYWVRFPAAWRGGTYLLGVYGSRLTNQWSAYGKIGVCPTGDDFFSSFVIAGAGDPGPLRFSTYHLNMPRTGTQCFGDEGASTLYQGLGVLTRDAWHHVEFFVQANTPGESNGVQRMWIDGTLRGEWTALRFRNTTNLVISSIQLLLYSPTTIAQTQTLYVDDVVVTQSTPPVIASIDVTPASASLATGASTQLAATARDAAGNPVAATFAWASSNPGAVSISSSGLATALATGTADITASSNGISGHSAITVGGATPVASVSVVPASGTVPVGQALQFVATPRDAAGNPLTGRSVTWTSSQVGVATVDNTGRAVGVSAGTTVLRATSEGQSGTASLTVTGGSPPSQAPVAFVSISPASGSVQVGQTVQFTATARDAAGNVLTGRTVNWYSNHPGYATIDASGRATGQGVGSAAIVANVEGIGNSVWLTVTNTPPPPPPPQGPVAFVSISPASGSVQVGQTLQFTATARDVAGNVITGRTVSWYSNHPGYATIDASGRATGRGAGSAAIVANVDGVGASVWLTVTDGGPPPPAPVATVTVAPATASIGAGQTVQLAATLRDAAGNVLTGRTISWSSGTPAVALVSSSGVVTGVAAGGPVTITATSEGRSGTGAVTVTAPPPPPPPVVTQIVVTPASVSLATGATQQFTATAQMSNGTQQPATVTWTATGGTVTPVGLYTAGVTAGSYRVIATQQGGTLADTAAVTLTVPPPPPPGGSLAWFDDFRTSLTSKGLTWWLSSPAQVNRVLTSSTTGTWPSQLTHVAENVFAATHGAGYQASNLWPAPAVGQYLFLRMLLNNALPNGANIGTDHGFQTNVGVIYWFWRVWGGNATSFTLEFSTWDALNVNMLNLNVPKNTVLRLEWRAERTATSTARLAARVYNNQTGALLGEITGLVQPGITATTFREFIFGMSGQGGATYNGGSVYWGALAARVSDNANDWIGAYPVAGVER